MSDGVLIYTKLDYEKNVWFATRLIDCLSEVGLCVKLVFAEDMELVAKDGLYVNIQGEPLCAVKFAINRSRSYLISRHLEAMGVRCFNSADVTRICNHKGLSHQLVNATKIPSAKTIIARKSGFNPKYHSNFPYVVKSVSGHGGAQVYKVHSLDELEQALSMINGEEFILQDFQENCIGDLRVFVIGGEIVSSILRSSQGDFRANHSLGGNSKLYLLAENEREQVQKICELLEFDFVGIDFLLCEDKLLFNEIEDVVGTRALYKNSDIDAAFQFAKYIKSRID